MTLSFYQIKTHKITVSGSSSFHKFLYNNPRVLLKLPMMHCVDTWTNDNGKKPVYVIRMKFKKFGQ